MDEYYSLQESLKELKRQLAEKKAEKQVYLDKAAAIDAIYDRMHADKITIKNYRDSYKTLYRERFDTFKGYQYMKAYTVKAEALLESYKTLISNIDINLDALNMKKASYENMAYKCDGPIGYLESAINTAVHTIENWFN